MDGIIFDVDGTLWDSTEVVAVGYNTAIRENTDFPANVTAETLKGLFGKPMTEIMAALMPGLSYEEQCRMAVKCYEREHEELEKKPGTLFEGVGETLQALSLKYPLFIVSNCQKGYIELFLRKTGFGPFIRGHLCFGDTGTSKGQTILRLMRENNLHEVVYVGDTAGDAAACKEAGIPFVYAKYGFGSVENPDYSITSIRELTALF